MTRVLIAAFDGLLPSQIRADTSECADASTCLVRRSTIIPCRECSETELPDVTETPPASLHDVSMRP